MSVLSLFVFVVGVSAASSFINSPSEDIALQDALSSDSPGYFKEAQLVVRNPDWIPGGSPLSGINLGVYDRVKPAIQDFTRAVLTNEIEITAECFFSLLVNWLVANDEDLTSPTLQTRITHQMHLASSDIIWGNPDLVIESVSSTGEKLHVTIAELKYFGRKWEKKFETQLCSYMLGYFDNPNSRGVKAHGVISNMLVTKHYNCDVKLDTKKCICQVSREYYLFNKMVGTLPANSGYSNFDHEFFLEKYTQVLKELHTISPPSF